MLFGNLKRIKGRTMSEEQNQPQQEALTPEQQQQRSIQWQRSCVQAAQKHLADKGVLPQSIIEKECRYIEPLVALWKIKGQKVKTNMLRIILFKERRKQFLIIHKSCS